MAGGAGKRLLLTGPPGVGKTTLIVRVLDMIPTSKMQGFYTQEMREGGGRAGFEVVTVDGRTSLLASSNVSSVGMYKVDIASFESVALPELQVKEDTPNLLVIDEVGKMEMFSPSFFPAVLKVFESNIPLLAGEVAMLKNQPGVSVITLSGSNRDSTTQQVFDLLAAQALD